jgi:hypothetical protein
LEDIGGKMRNKKILHFYVYILLILILLAGCSSNTASVNTYVEGLDCQYMYITQCSGSVIAESEEGYYFICGHFIYYADKQTMEPVVLCNKPNCLHEKESNPEMTYKCNAFVYGIKPFITYYNKNIYVTTILFGLEDKFVLQKLSLDGTKRETVLTFDREPNSLVIHRGKVYYTDIAYDKNKKSHYAIKEFELDKINAKPEALYLGTLKGGKIQDLICYGNNLYFREYVHSEELFATRSMRYDLLTQKANRIFTENDNEYNSHLAIYKDKLFSRKCSFINLEFGTYSSYTCNLDGSDIQKTFDIDQESVFLADRHYLYSKDADVYGSIKTPDEKRLIVLEDGNELGYIVTGHFWPNTSIICGGDSHLFIMTEGNEKLRIFYADKSTFSTKGEIELKLLIELDDEDLHKSVVIKY